MALLNINNLKTLVAIGELDKRKKFICQATGFLVGFIAKNSKDPQKRSYSIFLVTNRHVFEGKKEIYLRLNKKDGKPLIVKEELYFPTNEVKWLAHRNTIVDLALLNINAQALVDNKIDSSIFNEEMFARCDRFNKIGIEVGDSVFILGFPMGVAGQEQNYPYVKSGIISRFDKEIVSKNKAYLIDSSIFPGNSGSPIVLKPEIQSLQGTNAISQIYFLGVISGYLPYEERLYSHQANPPIPVSLERENSGLSYVVPPDFIFQIFHNWLKQKKKLEKAQKEVEKAQSQVEGIKNEK